MSPTSVLCQLMTRRVKPGHLWEQQCPGGPVSLITLLPVLLTYLLLSDLQEHWGPRLLILSYLIFRHVATDKRSLGHGTCSNLLLWALGINLIWVWQYTMNKRIIESHARDKAFTGKPSPGYNLFWLTGQDLNSCHFSASLAHYPLYQRKQE